MPTRIRQRFAVVNYDLLLSDYDMTPENVLPENYLDERRYTVSGVFHTGHGWDSFQWKCPTLPDYEPTEAQLNHWLKDYSAQRVMYDELHIVDEPDFYGN